MLKWIISVLMMFEFTGPTLRMIRKEQGLTLEELAARSKCQSGQISRIERKIQSPKLKTLGKIIRGLGLTRSQFFRRYHQVEKAERDQRARQQRDGEESEEYVLPLGAEGPQPGLIEDTPLGLLGRTLEKLPMTLQSGYIEMEDAYLVFHVHPKPGPPV